MIYNPKNDGIDHINVYSKGQTNLGRTLSNFAFSPFRIPFMGKFRSIEGFWYWCGTKNEKLRELYGFEAKKVGRSLFKVANWPDKRLLKIAYKAKLKSHPILKQRLKEESLPFVHYYIYGDKVVVPKEFTWTADLWNEIRLELLTKK